MKKENFFYLMIVLTILTTRISIIIVPEIDITLSGIIIHHFWFGIILMIIGLIIPKQKSYQKILVYGIGTGLIIDQLLFIILGGGKDKEYWALPSIISTIVITATIHPIRKKITNLLLKNEKIKKIYQNS